ncbi:MAG TPA: diacylglycerol kinase family lipid kinase [Candidatus Flavonifractor intestinigallinarum]|uniref:Diacylglycerol kinase family lipid kinase n=2 Tax=Flavonifractor TaxID=946234 RepID=A0A9D2MMH1_9FIRM|nr:diacylglycerol kinase family lipid kinase [Candidatus Flavonifractor intestinigallinarum]
MNPHAGKFDRSQEMLEKIRHMMAGRREEWSAVRTQGPGHAVALVEEAARQGDELRVYACGGDGTLNEVVNGAAGRDHVAVTHCPMGSGNDFLRIFGQDAGRFWQLDQLLDAPQTAMDLIECNGRYALNVCSVGFDARICFGAAYFKKLPLVSGTAAYQLSALRTIIRGIHLPYQVEIDRETMPGERFTLLCACNGRYYGGGFNPSPTAMPDDGALDFIVIPAVSRFTVLALIKKFARGEIGEIPQAILRRGRTMNVICDRKTAVNVDGELVEGTDLSIRLSDQKVQFFYPAGATWQGATPRQMAGTAT